MRLVDQRALVALAIVLVAGSALFLIELYSKERLGVETHTENGEKGRNLTVRIGVMSTSRSTDQEYRLLARLAEDEINEYCSESGVDHRFQFVFTCAGGHAANSRDLTEQYHQDGIDLVIGYGWSSFLCSGTRPYAEENGMVLMSPSMESAYWDFAFGPDYPLFRLCPSETAHVRALLKMMNNLGIDSVFVVIQDGASSWDDSILAAFEESLTGMGGTVQKTPRYTYTFEENFTSYLDEVEPKLQDLCQEYGRERTGVLMITLDAGDESIIKQAASYPTLMNVTWFSSEKSSYWPHRGFNESDIANIRLFSPTMKPRYGSLYESMNQTFFREFDWSLGYYDANVYDCCWIMALSVLEAGTADGTEVAKVLPEVASSYRGVTGLCSLNEKGERAHVDYDLRGFFEVNGTYQYLKCGFYNGSTGTITWDEGLMGGAARSG